MKRKPPPHSPLQKLARALARRRAPQRLCGLHSAAQAVAAEALLAAHKKGPALLVAPGAHAADSLAQNIRTALGENPEAPDAARVQIFPQPDAPPYDRFSPQPALTAQRIGVLHRLAAGGAPLVLTTWAALALRVPARAALQAATVQVQCGAQLERDELVAQLCAHGYARQPLALEPGELAVRGGVVDVFPPQRRLPVRVEFLGAEVETLREFDPASQRSQRALQSFAAPPPRELLGGRETVLANRKALRAAGEKLKVPAQKIDALMDALLRGRHPPGAEALAAFLQPAQESLFAYFPENAPVFLAEPQAGRARLRRFYSDAQEAYEALVLARERVACKPEALLLSPEQLQTELQQRNAISLEALPVHAPGARMHQLQSAPHDLLQKELHKARQSETPAAPLLKALRGFWNEGLRPVITAAKLSEAERLRALLTGVGAPVQLVRAPAPASQWGAPPAEFKVQVRVAALSEGFVFTEARLAVITEAEILGARRPRPRAQAFGRGGKSIAAAGKSLAAFQAALSRLSAGDLLVHAEHGIGRYRGLVELEIGQFRAEFLRMEYAGGDRIFVPVHRLNLVQRYIGAEGAQPALDKLGGENWRETKRRVRRKVHVLAKELLSLHAARELAPGNAAPPRDSALREFEARFPYQETPDQAEAIEDVLTDLSKPRPMDRLVCGDAGYGKTEVALRAAHQVAMAGRQVALLAPTTVLCQQHAETFAQRFAELPVQCAALSRFCTPQKARTILEQMADGRLDIVIGTHRLLQKNVQFRDLGLLIVDEEHRFGVAHKERIKKIKQNVDVLTLTATPIPRTLQLAFSGLRDLSIIHTPPPDRLAVRTRIARFDEGLIREAITRELQRGGQVFFVHNRVKTIFAFAELLERLAPEAKLLVAHGQLPERELEQRMLAFMKGDYDVLLCTTIIESGLDIPRANTIIINRADALGLAQLYQLRGRVGRAQRRAYAYLLVPGEAALTADAARRLDALQGLSELGGGFQIANMDLEIRGAGNLLGGEQSGHLNAVGYETYMEMLGEAVEELRGGDALLPIDPEIKLPVAARLPESYVADTSQRLVLYKRLSGAPDGAAADALRDELLDRFGPLPPQAELLLEIIRLKIAARNLGIVRVEYKKGALVFTAAEVTKIAPDKLVQLLKAPGGEITVTPSRQIQCRMPNSPPATVANNPAGNPAAADPADNPAALFSRAHWLMAQLQNTPPA